MLIVGDKDAAAEAVSVRLRDGSERRGVPIADFLAEISADVASRQLEPGSGVA
jgi:threonyl-tRNA synthetase